MRHIINCVVVKISDSEFKELMQTLDPGGTGLVNVKTFIELLKEDPKVSAITSSHLIFYLWQETEVVLVK